MYYKIDQVPIITIYFKCFFDIFTLGFANIKPVIFSNGF